MAVNMGSLGTYDPAKVADLQKLAQKLGMVGSGQNPDPQQIQFLLDEIDAQNAAGAAGIGTQQLAGFNFGQVASVHDFMTVLGYAETFAAATGWAYFPTAAQIRDLAKQGGVTADQAFTSFWGHLPPTAQNNHPGARYGLDNQAYLTQSSQYMDAFEQYTGNRGLDPNILNQAMSEHWSPQHFQNWLFADPGTNSKYGWMKWGYNYASWQTYKAGALQQIRQRYGNQVDTSGDSYFLQNLSNPLNRTQAVETPFRLTSMQASFGQTAANTGYESAVR